MSQDDLYTKNISADKHDSGNTGNKKLKAKQPKLIAQNKKDSNFSSLTSFNNNSYGNIYNFS